MATRETDSAYFLKLVIYLVLGSFWVKLLKDATQIPLPIGFLVGLLISKHDKFQIDRKIEYALLLVAMFVGFWLPLGLYIAL